MYFVQRDKKKRELRLFNRDRFKKPSPFLLLNNAAGCHGSRVLDAFVLIFSLLCLAKGINTLPDIPFRRNLPQADDEQAKDEL
ncbi:hypothetical protein ACTXT7_005400 [Hymenolepis weldensis]